jgi:hypothetical protein
MRAVGDVALVPWAPMYGAPRAVWPRELRQLRAPTHGLVPKGPRAGVFSTGLEQAEQLWNASTAVGPVAAPLLLFYGLTQAGRALVAAGAPNNRWPEPKGHGLSFDCRKPANRSVLGLTDAHVSPRGTGLVKAVAGVLGSPVLETDVSVQVILSSLETTSFCDAVGPTPLTVWNDWQAPKVTDQLPARLIIAYAPDEWASRVGNPQSLHGMKYRTVPDPSVSEVVKWLDDYPRLAALGSPTQISMYPRVSTDIPAGQDYEKYYIRLEWAEPLLGFYESTEWATSLFDVDKSMIGEACKGTVIPPVGGNAKAQHPLIGWWLALYAFSMLARYFPQEWMRLLDVDRSPIATSIEAFLDEARTTVPDLVHRALLVSGETAERVTQGHIDRSSYGRAAPD